MRWWLKLIFALAAIAVLLAVAWALLRNTGALLGWTDGGAGAPDPMFAEEAQTPTRPPELDAEETPLPHKTLDDYVPEVETPVDKTAEELIREAQERNAD